jgi:hypothetical protein
LMNWGRAPTMVTIFMDFLSLPDELDGLLLLFVRQIEMHRGIQQISINSFCQSTFSWGLN